MDKMALNWVKLYSVEVIISLKTWTDNINLNNLKYMELVKNSLSYKTFIGRLVVQDQYKLGSFQLAEFTPLVEL